MTAEVFIPGNPPRATGQQKRINRYTGQYYDTPAMAAAKELYMVFLKLHHPERKLAGPIRFTVEWRFYSKSQKPGRWKTTRPDTDNLQKMLKDCCTSAGWWEDDAQVCVEKVSKIWTTASNAGIMIRAEEIENEV